MQPTVESQAKKSRRVGGFARELYLRFALHGATESKRKPAPWWKLTPPIKAAHASKGYLREAQKFKEPYYTIDENGQRRRVG